ncbi:rhomboid family intramembrane serine protease [Desulfobacula phenolica]|uniref:Membrane associated serine protease, rhomboid family n=1 Tax=Desulfobacula phenolica TaxID=90732 RepID=A0A1H2FKR9_9BACT|nr:rhomboid family intramembrane serine protease [Desulfobacula phenolica]SDU07946.1 Membrane associated serine protease, rhomboid family [Desulfobacula phenolica]
MSKDLEKLFAGLSGEKADLIILILTSQNIKAHAEGLHKSFDILVSSKDRQKALATIEAYYKENKYNRLKQQLQQIPISSFKSIPAFFIMGLLCLIHVSCLEYHIHEDMIFKYGVSALFILQGETYRAVTALMLHSDARHLLGNMAGLLIFGAPVISLSGFGAGPFMLLFTGTAGNLINAHFHKTAHLSIGASTSVMGAAGLLVAFRITQTGKPFRWNTLLPMIAGAVLVGMFSQGERTDVWAHVFGFLCGVLSGIFFFPLNRTINFPQKNTMALFISLLIIAAALLSATQM